MNTTAAKRIKIFIVLLELDFFLSFHQLSIAWRLGWGKTILVLRSSTAHIKGFYFFFLHFFSTIPFDCVIYDYWLYANWHIFEHLHTIIPRYIDIYLQTVWLSVEDNSIVIREMSQCPSQCIEKWGRHCEEVILISVTINIWNFSVNPVSFFLILW